MSDRVEDTKPVVCRLCMSTEPGQIKLFHGGEKSPLCQKIKGCLSIQIYLEDTLTKFVCQACVCRVDDIYAYQQLCIRTQSVLEKENVHPTQEVSIDAIVEAEKIVERLQAERSSLSITPVGPKEVQKVAAFEDVFDSPSALSITPILRNSESSGDDDAEWDFTAPFAPLPHLKDPSAEDYILIQEETFRVDPAVQYTRDAYEYRLKHDDFDVVGTQLKRRVVLPPMWDVYEKGTDNENIIHRRYIISKKSFSCSLCGSCVAFRCQKVLDSSKHESQIKVTLQDMLKAKHVPNDETDIQVPENEEIQDSRFSHSSQDGMFDCPECGKLFPRRSSWKRHLRSHFEGRSFLCPLCGKGFSRKEHLSRHMMSHTGGRPFSCESCSKPFTRKEHLARHLACNPACARNSSGSLPCLDQEPGTSISRPYTCGICFQGFMHKEHLRRHQRRAHLLMDGCVTPPCEEDFQLHRCNNCNTSFATMIEKNEHVCSCHEHFTHTVPVENEESSLSYTNDKNSLGSPEQIEVEVNLVEDGSDAESTIEEGDPAQINEEDVPHFALIADHDVMEPDQEDTVPLQTNEAMRKAQVGSESPGDALLHCEVCQKSFTHQSHLVCHLNRFHPHVEIAHAASQSLGKVPGAEDLETSVSFIESGRDDDDDEADDESGSTQSSLPSNPSVSVSMNKGRHPCSICGKTFGRRYHLVRHRRTQHGVESVRTGPLGRPPKRFVVSKPFYCSVCDGQFSSRNAYRLHLCINVTDSNNPSFRSGGLALAEMAAKISDKLHRGMGSLDFSCQNCSQRFCNKLELDKHMETHVDDEMRDMLWK